MVVTCNKLFDNVQKQSRWLAILSLIVCSVFVAFILIFLLSCLALSVGFEGELESQVSKDASLSLRALVGRRVYEVVRWQLRRLHPCDRGIVSNPCDGGVVSVVELLV